MATFEDLSDDILYLILQHLRLERPIILQYFRRVSARLKAFAESVLHRHIILHDDEQHELASYRLIERLSDINDDLGRHVRSLEIKAFKGDDKSHCMNTAMLLTVLNRLHKLHSFSWNSSTIIPEALLNTLQKRFPDAQLHATVKGLDQRLLQSHQLSRLAISLPCSNIPIHESLSIMQQLKEVLIQCHNLRSLSLDVHPDFTVRKTRGVMFQTESTSPFLDVFASQVQLPLQPGDKLPPLEDLDIRTNMYHLDSEHCKLLQNCLDWKRLKRLRLGPSNPRAFFEVFKGVLPQLETLDFTYHSSYTYHPDSGHYFSYSQPRTKLVSCARFIALLPALNELVVRGDIIDLSDTLWTTLVQRHGDSLRSLSIQACYDHLEAPDGRGRLWELFSCFSNLTTLDVALRGYFSNSRMCLYCSLLHSHSLSAECVKAIPVLRTLRTLRLSIRISPSNERSLLRYVADQSHCAFRHLWSVFADAPHETSLETFSMHFWRWELPFPHSEEYGQPRNVRVSQIVVESQMKNGKLMVKPLHRAKVAPVYYYKQVQLAGGDKFRTSYEPEVSQPH